MDSLDLREETASIILYMPILGQKVAAEYQVFHFCANKGVRKKLTPKFISRLVEPKVGMVLPLALVSVTLTGRASRGGRL